MPAILAMWLLLEHMKENRHSTGSWRSTRAPARRWVRSAPYSTAPGAQRPGSHTWEASREAAEALVPLGPLCRERRQPSAQKEVLSQGCSIPLLLRISPAREHTVPHACCILDQAELRRTLGAQSARRPACTRQVRRPAKALRLVPSGIPRAGR